MEHHNQFVRCIENVQDLSGQKEFDYALILGGGGMYSRKTIRFNPKTKVYTVKNHIDNSTERLTARGFLKLFGKAMQKRCLIACIN